MEYASVGTRGVSYDIEPSDLANDKDVYYTVFVVSLWNNLTTVVHFVIAFVGRDVPYPLQLGHLASIIKIEKVTFRKCYSYVEQVYGTESTN